MKIQREYNKNIRVITKSIYGMMMLMLSLDSTLVTQQQIYTRNHLINYQIHISALKDAIDYAQAKIVQRKTATITVEGKEIILNLDWYEYNNLLTTYYSPEDFLVDELSSEEGKGVIFTGKFRGEKVENAYVHFAFLNFCKTLPEVEKFLNDKDGLITSNRWRVVFRSQKVPYFWAKEKIVFSKGKDIVGEIYIGRSKGKFFYVITHFPVGYGDRLPQSADIILQNLRIEN